MNMFTGNYTNTNNTEHGDVFELPSELAITMMEENVEVKMEEVPLGACY